MSRKPTKIFSSKPFSVQFDDDERTVYMPRRTVKINKKKERICECVHLCDQFLTYPVDEWGVRCIPKGEVCKYRGQFCRGNLLFKNGQPFMKNPSLSFILKDKVNTKER